MHVHEGRYEARAEFLEILEPVLDMDAIDWMRSERHHLTVTIFDHSMFVAYVAYLLARGGMRGDPAAAARAGFLHDLYMYHKRIAGSHDGIQCFDHPAAALANSTRLFPWLSWRERNAIEAHMFPLAKHVPRCREAWAVTLADKFCAILELCQLYRLRLVRRHRPGPAPVLASSTASGNISP